MTERRSRVDAAAERHAFQASPLLGARAFNVYTAFVRSLDLPGDVAECGVFTGETSAELVRYLEAAGVDKTVHMFDAFEGLPPLITAEERALASGDALREANFRCDETGVETTMTGLSRYELHGGLFSDTFPSFDRRLCFIHADADLYESTVGVIELAERCLVPGGTIVFDDYESPFFPGVKLAVDRHVDPGRFEMISQPGTTQCFARKKPLTGGGR